MPEPPFLDRLEASYERMLVLLEGAISYPIAALERYFVRMYQFLWHVAIKTLRLVWLLAILTLYLAAPLFLLSFGHEIWVQGKFWYVSGFGAFLVLIGFGGLLIMVWGLIVYFLSPSTLERQPNADRKIKIGLRGAIFLIFLFDVSAIFLVYAIATLWSPGYVFVSPLLHLTQSCLSAIH